MRIVINVPPRTKKNSMQIIRIGNRYSLIPSKQYKEYEKACKPYLEGLVINPINHPVNVKCTFYRGSKHRVDLCNLEEAAHDVLVKYGVLADDNRDIIASTEGSRVLYDKENPRTEIEITDYVGEYDVWKS